MRFKSLMTIGAAVALLPTAASADNAGFFGGAGVLTGTAYGSSGTKKAGSVDWNARGVVRDIEFGTASGINVHAGYRFNPRWSTFVSYQYVRGDVRWEADYPVFDTSRFEGTAVTHSLMLNLSRDFALSERTSARLQGGIGAAFNTLANIDEVHKPSGIKGAELADNTHAAPAAQIGLGVHHRVAPNMLLGADALVAYVGGFETGKSRYGSLGKTAIHPYKIDDVWRANLNVSLSYAF